MYGKHISESKTKTMVFKKGPEENDAEVYVDGIKIKNCYHVYELRYT